MFSRLKQFLACIFLLAFFCLSFSIAFGNDLADECELNSLEQKEDELTRVEYRELLEKCKQYYEQRTDEIGDDIEKTEAEKASLANKIYLLGSKITSLNYQISQGNIMIKDLGSQIEDTQGSITKTEAKIDDIKSKLASLLQLKYEEDQKSTVEILLAEETLSGFFDNLVALEMLNLKTQEFLKNIKDLKDDLETQKTSMDTEKKDLENVVIIQTLQKQESASNKQEQEYFLELTELEYEKYVQDKKEAEQKAVAIGNMLFELLEVPEGGIKFEDAVAIAKNISEMTGVRAAFALAILWQETRIGKLKGGCYLSNTSTGEGIYILSGNKAPKTMKPTRDVQPFLRIIRELNDAGFLATDAYHTPVSCCMIRSGEYFGWGGAMGPAQFIPSTWMLYKDEIEKNTGSVPANPWNVRDSFLASSLYLKRLGASSQTYATEINSALRYFGCTSWWCRVNYGEPVMEVSSCFQQYINTGAMSASCRSLAF